ncbi:MAG TPA: recombinase family protein, partial [Bacteroides sp.]|nr:recombinase family protein [Bacteroides sp.]
MKIGYARISSNDQEMMTQVDALRKFGCKKIYEDS